MVALAFLGVSCLALTMTTSRQPTARKFEIPKSLSTIEAKAEAMSQRAKEGAVFTEEELQQVVNSIQNVYPSEDPLDWEALRDLVKEVACLSHKDWQVTDDNSRRLASTLLPKGVDGSARQLLERILLEGNWDGAVSNDSKELPWAVLVTGVNGIRKTTSIYQPWFRDVLKEALLVPPGGAMPSDFPVGANSFFRQLDHMIASLCNHEFATLYQLAHGLLDSEAALQNPPKEAVTKYSNLKAAIFSRYRTLSELLGAALLREAKGMNCMLETSGRDVAMFHYVDHFFPQGYRKLALHFTINDLEQAKESVDRRMITEIQTGVNAIEKGCAFDVIYANAGGPYGSEVLDGIQKDSDQVWSEQVLSRSVGADWYKATIQINAYADKPWTARAVKPDGSLGTEFTFQR